MEESRTLVDVPLIQSKGEFLSKPFDVGLNSSNSGPCLGMMAEVNERRVIGMMFRQFVCLFRSIDVD